MIRKISLSILFLCLIIAIPLALMGYTKVEVGKPALALINVTSYQLRDFKVQIPDIPEIPLFENPSGFQVVLQVLAKIGNALITIVNVLDKILNFVIKIIAYIFVIIKNLIKFKDNVQPYIDHNWGAYFV